MNLVLNVGLSSLPFYNLVRDMKGIKRARNELNRSQENNPEKAWQKYDRKIVSLRKNFTIGLAVQTTVTVAAIALGVLGPVPILMTSLVVSSAYLYYRKKLIQESESVLGLSRPQSPQSK